MDDPSDELPDAIYDRVTELSEKGNLLMEAGEFDGAISEWEAAFSILPEPKRKWDAAMWLHASIGDAWRAKGEIALAIDAFDSAYNSGDGATNPFVLYSLGACHLDLGHTEAARDFLLRAYMMEGEDIFNEDDPKYLDLLRRQKLGD